MPPPPPPGASPGSEDPWAKFFLIGVAVTILDLLLYPYLKVALVPYISWGGLLLFLALGAAVGYVVAWKRGGGYVLWLPVGAVVGLATGYELARHDPVLLVAILVGVAASGLSVGIGSVLT